MQTLCKDLAEDIFDLSCVLNAGSRLHHFAVAIINGERQPAEGAALRQALDGGGLRNFISHITKVKVGLLLPKYIENIIDWNAHWSHSSAADSDLFVVFDQSLQFFLAINMFQVGLKHFSDLLESFVLRAQIDDVSHSATSCVMSVAGGSEFMYRYKLPPCYNLRIGLMGSRSVYFHSLTNEVSCLGAGSVPCRNVPTFSQN